ncbi:MAG: 4-(cytidine 5'-diphospho)-2-C-methyl-D-erythritol kinase [Nitrospirae bacterium]|nr:4-(cytidine 5'-diphospho)-2-C-methyl-D-erythritol kinase [Nitrospirota bacterium]
MSYEDFCLKISLKTPAKVNLFLQITGKRDDGYHDIFTVMQMVELWDELIIEHNDTLKVICSNNDALSGEDNLIYKAALKLKEYSGVKAGAKITLKKIIPVGAGLGGGSSDAAAALYGLNKLWGTGFSNERLSAIGSELGSDVPFFLNGPTAIGCGRGDELIPLSYSEELWFLLINPGIHISTAWAYKQFELYRSLENPQRSPHPHPNPPLEGEGIRTKHPLPQGEGPGEGGVFIALSETALHDGPSENKPPIPPLKQRGGFLWPAVSAPLMTGSSEILSNSKFDNLWIGPFSGARFELTNEGERIKIPLPKGIKKEGDKLWLSPFNDFEEVMTKKHPVIENIKEKMVAGGAMCSLMSGSGSTVFGIFRDKSSAERVFMLLQDNGWNSWVVKSLHRPPYS